MNVRTMLQRINMRIGTMDDIGGRGINPIIPNRYILLELNCALEEYANVTKAITDIYSFPLNINTPFVAAPPLALRSESYYYMLLVQAGVLYPMDMRPPRDVFPRFRNNPIAGISNWVMPWGAGKAQFLTLFPMKNVSALTTTLSADCSESATTLSVASTSGFMNNHGRITIGSEKILYESKTTTTFVGCQRGVESTTAAMHTSGDTVTENNVIIFYARLPTPLQIYDNDIIPDSVLDFELEIPEEHDEGIIKAAAYPIVMKIDPERATVYKQEADALYQRYKADIAKGYYRGRMGVGVRDLWAPVEGGMPYGANLIY
jgi:hypothetical protein